MGKFHVITGDLAGLQTTIGNFEKLQRIMGNFIVMVSHVHWPKAELHRRVGEVNLGTPSGSLLGKQWLNLYLCSP